MTDSVNQPAHYNYGDIECIDAIRAMLGEEGFKSYCRGNAAKYTWRAGLKINEVEDLQKAAWYNRMAAGDDPRTKLPKPGSIIEICKHERSNCYECGLQNEIDVRPGGTVRPLTEDERKQGWRGRGSLDK